MPATTSDFDPRQPIESERELLAWISSETGIQLHDHQLAVFREGITKACQTFNCATPGGFFNRLKNSPPGSLERQFLINHITVGETYFFRIPEQINFLRRHWLPQTIAKKRAQGHLNLRIWSAGCSGGEELYTMGLLLHEALPDIREWSIHLVGTDINAEALRKAREGIYSPWSLRTLSAEERTLHFDNEGNRYQLHPRIQNMAQFLPLNLASDPYPSMTQGICAMDLILCRNVFIYFTHQAITRIMRGFAETLDDNGCLLLAPADPISQEPTGLRMIASHDVTYFERGDNPSTPVQAAPTFKPVQSAPPTPPATSPTPTFTPVQAMEQTPTPSVAQLSTELEKIQQQLAAHRWDSALLSARQLARQNPNDPSVHYWLASTQSALGETKEALASCERGLECDSMDAALHHLRGTLLLDQDERAEAEAEFRRALYLDWDRPDTHFQLAMLKERTHDAGAVLKHLKDALQVSSRQPAAAPVDKLSDMTFGRLTEILEQEIFIRTRSSSRN